MFECDNCKQVGIASLRLDVQPCCGKCGRPISDFPLSVQIRKAWEPPLDSAAADRTCASARIRLELRRHEETGDDLIRDVCFKCPAAEACDASNAVLFV